MTPTNKTPFKPSSYLNSLSKLIFDIVLSSILLIVLSPIFIIISLSILLTSGLPIFFIQKRVGKNGKVFNLIKFRTMKKGSPQQQWRYQQLNQADGPVFKITHDPRHTLIGKYLDWNGIDELPQLLNIIKTDMSLVGPRPLIQQEVKQLTSIQKNRQKIRPGITSPWITKGGHQIPFDQWMSSDLEYLTTATLSQDIQIIISTLSHLLLSI